MQSSGGWDVVTGNVAFAAFLPSQAWGSMCRQGPHTMLEVGLRVWAEVFTSSLLGPRMTRKSLKLWQFGSAKQIFQLSWGEC